MSRDINLLVPKVRDACLVVVSECKKIGVDLLITDTLRTLQEQAILFRQSRTRYEIDEKVKKFETRGFDFLAKILVDVGPQNGKVGRHVTCACCGESFHNYGEAFDVVPIVSGKAIWNTSDPKWRKYGQQVRNSGLIWAGDWISFTEYPHAQLRLGSNPLKLYPPDTIKEMLKSNGLI